MRIRPMWAVLGLITIGLLIAAACNAPLTWDGSHYLFQTIDLGRPFIAHDRLIDAPLHWPVIWVNSITSGIHAASVSFHLIHVVTPLVSLAFSWWVVRKTAPGLIMWPIVGIGLATLPGQINFISEGIKANQLIWPALLSVLIGLPARTVPMVTIVALVIMYLHPAAVPIFASLALAAVVTGLIDKQYRERLYPAAACLVIAALLRYDMVSGGYERSELSWETQQRQWRSATGGLPGIALIASAATALWLLIEPRIRIARKYSEIIPLLGVAVAGGVLVVWAADAHRWSEALEFRGPANVVSLLTAGAAFLDATLARVRKEEHLTAFSGIRARVAITTALVFALVISIQSVSWQGELNALKAAMANSDDACVPTSQVAGFEDSPIDFWSLPSTSILIQGDKPDHIVLPEDICNSARTSGVIPLTLLDPDEIARGKGIDMLHLRGRVASDTACMAQFGRQWYPLERSGIDYRKWNSGIGDFDINMQDEGVVVLRGVLDSWQTPNEVKILVNGQQQRAIMFEDDRYAPLDGIELRLQEGVNTIEIVSMRPGASPEGDDRTLATAVVNMEITHKESGSLCTWTDM